NTNYPDYMVTSGSLIPKVMALYSVVCRGGFRSLMRFEGPASGAPVGFGALLAQMRRRCEGQAMGVVLMAESAGLLGASLKRPPVAGGGPVHVFQHPEIRNWLSFSPERTYTRSVAVIAGVASDSPPPQVSPLLRPVTSDGALMGHFHAAAFGYHPLQKGRIDLATTVSKLFDTGGLQGIVHLLRDDRPAAGAGESEFLRGACWFGPIDRFVTAGETL
ncbi:MAG: anti-sigma factor antagonist, partial [Bryobacteraceae bacterium]